MLTNALGCCQEPPREIEAGLQTTTPPVGCLRHGTNCNHHGTLITIILLKGRDCFQGMEGLFPLNPISQWNLIRQWKAEKVLL